jgi:predicted transcriptional regulator
MKTILFDEELTASKNIGLRLDVDLDEKLKQVAKEQNLSKSATMRAMLKFALNYLAKSK